MTYSRQQWDRAVGLYIRYECCAADAIHELGYPSKEALRMWYRERLEGERARLDGLIRSVTDTIHAEERNEIMQDEQKFEVFKRQAVECNEALYGREVREKYGDAQMDEANAAVMGLTQEQYRTWTGLGEEIRAGLERAVSEKLSPEGEEGRRIAALHRRWLTLTGNRYDPGKHWGLAALYTEDPRFTAYYDRSVPGCAWFLRAAVERWAETL